MIRIQHTWQGWCVLGGGLPHGVAWSIHETEGEARAAAYELAEDIGVAVQS
jgi:hypothetical protein